MLSSITRAVAGAAVLPLALPPEDEHAAKPRHTVVASAIPVLRVMRDISVRSSYPTGFAAGQFSSIPVTDVRV